MKQKEPIFTMKLFFRQLGQGEPVIILHGLFGMSDNWLTIARKIAEHHTVYLPDARNHGQSPQSPQLDYNVMLEDLKEFIAEHQLENIHLIGHSMGGKVAMRYALENPKQLAKPVIVDIAPKTYNRPLFRTFIELLQTINLDGLTSRKQADERLAVKINSPAIRQFLLKNLYRDDDLNFKWRINIDALEANIEKILGADSISGKYESPILFIRGGKSDYILKSDDALIKQYFPKARIHSIERAGHWVHAEAPDELCDALRLFF